MVPFKTWKLQNHKRSRLGKKSAVSDVLGTKCMVITFQMSNMRTSKADVCGDRGRMTESRFHVIECKWLGIHPRINVTSGIIFTLLIINEC